MYVVDAAEPFLCLLTHDDFKQHLLPALQKAMLRNPEIIIDSVGHILSGLSLDLSRYSGDELTKGLFANLRSKEDTVRDEAANVCKRLAQQCSDATCLDKLLSSIFALFHGSEGKLTVVTHKLSVLEAAGNLSYNAASGNEIAQNLAETACTHFIKVLESEVHEKTLIHAVEMMSLWSRKFTNKIPKNVIDAFKMGSNSKTWTSPVRMAYTRLLLLSVTVIDDSAATDITPLLLQAISRGNQQHSSAQPTTLPEALLATYLLLNFVIAGQVENNKQSILWNVIDEQIFFTEKFIATCTDDLLYNLMQLCDKLMSEFSDRLNDKSMTGLHRAIVACLTTPRSVTRRRCAPLAKKLLTALTTYEPARSLLAEFNRFLEIAKIRQDTENDREEDRDGSPQIATVTGRSLAEGLLAICSGSFVFEEFAYQLVADSLIPAHHSAIVKAVPNLWMKIVKNFKLTPREFVEKYYGTEIEIIKFYENYVPAYENALATLVSLAPNLMLGKLVSNVTKILDNPDILKVTKDEYFTYLTPEGELYDKSVIPGNDDESILSAMNMKRESKVYSFKEQQEELQLRREMYEKRKREGKIKEPKLTAKQEEALKAQIAREKAIRKRLSDFNTSIVSALSMINASAKGDKFHLSFHLKDILPVVLKNLGSPLAAPRMAQLYLDLGRIVTIEPTLSNLIAHVTLRQLEPQCDLDKAWQDEESEVAVHRTLRLLHNHTVRDKHTLVGPAFSYVFPFVVKTLLRTSRDGDEAKTSEGLHIVQEHARQRATTNDDDNSEDPRHPRLLPRKQMFDLLIEIMSSTSSGRIQSHVVATILDVANSGSGAEGCALATSDEIDSLLGALQNDVTAVRDAALRALTIVKSAFPKEQENYEQFLRLTRRIWVAKFDTSDEMKILAHELWEAAGLEAHPEILCEELIEDVAHPVEAVQQAAAFALAQLLENDKDADFEAQLMPTIIDNLLALYNDKLAMIPPKLNDFGRVVEQPIDTWGPRRGVALALAQLAPLLTPQTIHPLVQFFVSTGLGDRNPSVRTEMLTAALAAVDSHGKANIASLLPVFENFMDKAPKIGSFDSIKQSVVILMGCLARHLDKDDPRIKPIVMRLIAALSTPSQQVQEAVANCLPHLVPSIKDDAPRIVDNLMSQLLKSDKYGERKGAAYGLAGLIKGMGILALKQLDIMTTLTNAIQDKKNYRHREGALFAFEMLCTMLGRLFEPYIVHVLPHLLLCFGDSSQYVRTATDDTARVVMSKLSAHGVKLVLPSLLAALEEDSWRTKTGEFITFYVKVSEYCYRWGTKFITI